jgi:hypothetical protein
VTTRVLLTRVDIEDGEVTNPDLCERIRSMVDALVAGIN